MENIEKIKDIEGKVLRFETENALIRQTCSKSREFKGKLF